MEFCIEGRTVGADRPAYFIADIAANHDGKLERALQLIELAAKAGANAAKFQNFQAKLIVSRHGFERLGKMAHQDAWSKSVYEVYKEAEIAQDWTQSLREHCTKHGMAYFTSAYDIDSVELVDPYVGAYKIGSGDITYSAMLQYLASKGKPLLLATGASTLSEVIEAVTTLRSASLEAPLCLMQCNTNYTGGLENFRYISLRVLTCYATLFPDVVLGLSDHTPGHATVLGAVTLGARVIEKHFTDDTSREGPDHKFSMTPTTWAEMVARTRELEYAMGDSVKRVEPNELESIVVQRRALYAAHPIAEGTVISADGVLALRPCPTGAIPPSRLALVLGARAPKNYAAGDHFELDDWLRPKR